MVLPALGMGIGKNNRLVVRTPEEIKILLEDYTHVNYTHVTVLLSLAPCPSSLLSPGPHLTDWCPPDLRSEPEPARRPPHHRGLLLSRCSAAAAAVARLLLLL